MKRKIFAAALLGAALSPCSAYADDTMEIEVITPTRTAQKAGKTVADTTVITADDIRKAHAPDVPTLLKNVVGVEISQPGGVGKAAGVFLRGTNSDQVLILVDGVRLNSATTGTTSLDQLMADQIDHIEVVRGNVSSLYGSEAIGGVIQIFTKRGHGAPALNASAGVGSLGTRRASAGVRGEQGNTDFSVQLSTIRTDGVSNMDPTIYTLANPDRDGYRNNSVTASVGHAFNADHRISASILGSNGNSQYDNGFGLPTDVNAGREQMWKASVVSDDQFTSSWHSKLQLANGVDQYRDFTNGAPTTYFGQPSSLYQTTNSQLTWQNTLQFEEGKQLLLGAEKLRQHVSTDINPGYVQDTRTINSAFAGYTGHYDAHQVQLNLRQDRNSQYGHATTWLAGYGYAFSEAWRATASYSTAFRAPTFNDLYYPGFGNPALRPEHARSAEAGAHYHADSTQFDVVYFQNRIQDMIAFGAAFLPVNIDRAQIDGLELNYGGQFGDTGVKAGLTAQNPRNVSTGKQLTRRARLYGHLALSQQVGSWQLGGEWQYSGTRQDDFTDPLTFANSTKTLAAYNVFNLTASYPLAKDTKLQFRADNLTNQNDTSAYGYNFLGRRFFVSVNYAQ